MSNNTENIPPQVIKKVLKELSEIASEPLEGIKLIPSEQDICDIQGIIDGPAGTPYEGGFFRIKLVLCKGFPSQPPKGYFVTRIFHPNVASNGEICVNTLKKDWKPDLGIKHILLTIKCLLIVPNAESALNEEAGKLLLEDYDEYFSRAKLYTEVHARNSCKSFPNACLPNNTSSENIYANVNNNNSSNGSSSSSSSSSLTSSTNPLDSNKTINANTTSNNQNDEPNMKIAKMSTTTKKNDKKKALKRL